MVRTPVDEVQSEGDNETGWDGLDESGAQAASGVYHLHLIAGKTKETRKMVMVR